MRLFPMALMFLFCMVSLGVPADALAGAGDADDATVADADARLARLTALLRTGKSTRIDLVAAIDAVAESYATVGENERARDTWRKKADTQLVKALARYKAPRKGALPRNEHEAVAVRAAKALGDVAQHLEPKARRALGSKVRKWIDSGAFAKQRKQGVSQEQLDATLAIVGRINDPRALEWYAKKFMRTDNGQLPMLLAAHRSLVLFRDVPGASRHAIVRELITKYAGVEAQAEQGNSVAERSAKRFWDELKLATIPALQNFAGKPVNEEGEALATVTAFRDWFRAHKRVNRQPWID